MGAGWQVLEHVMRGVGALVEAYPTLRDAIMGGRSTEEWIADARAAVDALPVRTGPVGEWDEDLARRKERG